MRIDDTFVKDSGQIATIRKHFSNIRSAYFIQIIQKCIGAQQLQPVRQL
jgi:hypothetical protein